MCVSVTASYIWRLASHSGTCHGRFTEDGIILISVLHHVSREIIVFFLRKAQNNTYPEQLPESNGKKVSNKPTPNERKVSLSIIFANQVFAVKLLFYRISHGVLIAVRHFIHLINPSYGK